MDVQNNQPVVNDSTAGVNNRPVSGGYVKKPEHANLVKFKENYIFFIILSLAYAAIYTFGVYNNFSGIATTLYPVASVIYLILSAKKLELKIGKETVATGIAIVLFGINLCLTKDYTLIFLDNVAIFLLTVFMALHMFFEDSQWGLGKYLSQIIVSNLCAIEYISHFITDGVEYRKTKSNKPKNPMVGYVFIGILVTIPVLSVVLLLLGSADYFFGKFLMKIFVDPFVNMPDFNIGFVFMFVLALAMSYAFIRKMCAHTLSEKVDEVTKGPAAIAVTINAILGVVYLTFSGFQFATLILGAGELPADYTYAEYAREGFFQLVVVCLINMVLVLTSMYLSENTKVLKICLTVISACTYVMIASSTYRMIMYVKVYQLTYTRVFVFWALMVIFMAMNGITVYIYKREFKLFQYCVIMLTVLYMAFAYARPEGMIAKNNLSEKFYNSDSCERIDYYYLTQLSSDATPAMKEAFVRENDEHGMQYIIEGHVKEENSFIRNENRMRKFNFSEYAEYIAIR